MMQHVTYQSRDHENIISLFRETKKCIRYCLKTFQVKHKRGP